MTASPTQPPADHEPKESGRTFPDGCHFRIEVPTVNSVESASRLLSESVRRGFTINRLTETLGSYRHTEAQVRQYVQLGRDYGVEILMSVGPRATYDIGGSVHTREGARIGYRLRGQDQLIRALEDVRRAIDLGVRGFVVYDEGVLSVLGDLRSLGRLPADVSLKVSAHCGHGNPASARLLERLGAASFNPVREPSCRPPITAGQDLTGVAAHRAASSDHRGETTCRSMRRCPAGTVPVS